MQHIVRLAFHVTATLLCVTAFSAAARADLACKLQAKDDYMACKQGCKDDYLAQKLTCRNIDPTCGIGCLAGRQACRDDYREHPRHRSAAGRWNTRQLRHRHRRLPRRPGRREGGMRRALQRQHGVRHLRRRGAGDQLHLPRQLPRELARQCRGDGAQGRVQGHLPGLHRRLRPGAITPGARLSRGAVRRAPG